jgi:hypothetical protein
MSPPVREGAGAVVVHLLDTRGGRAALRRPLPLAVAAGQRRHRHLEIVIGGEAGSGLPMLARLESPAAPAVARAISALARQSPVARVIAWSTEAGAAVRTPHRSITVLDTAPPRWRWRSRDRDDRRGQEWAAWSPWLAALPAGNSLALVPVRPVPVPGVEPFSEWVSRIGAEATRAAVRTSLGIAEGELAAGLFCCGSAGTAGRSVARDGVDVLALARLAGAPIVAVLDEAHPRLGEEVSRLRRLGLADRVRTAPLRRDPWSVVTGLDLALLAGGLGLGGRAPIAPADTVLLPSMLRAAGVRVFAFAQPPWSSIAALSGMLLDADSPLRAAQRLQALLAEVPLAVVSAPGSCRLAAALDGPPAPSAASQRSALVR